MLRGIITGELRWFFVPEAAAQLKAPVGEEPRLPRITSGDWTFQANRRRRIIEVHTANRRIGTEAPRDGRPFAVEPPRRVGWFRMAHLAKATPSKGLPIVNAMYKQPPFTLKLDQKTLDELLVWLDQLEEQGLLAEAREGAPTDSELVKLDPRVRSTHQEADGFCDSDWRAPPRQAWWVYLHDEYYSPYMEGQTLHECSLKTILEHLAEVHLDFGHIE